MARSLVFSNGRLHVGLDEHGLVGDVYFPYVGLENHSAPHSIPHKIGVYADGALHWLDDESWSVTARYHDNAMIGETIATHDALGIRLEFTDCVDSDVDAFIRSIHVVNTRPEQRTIRLYCHQAFQISSSATSDTVQYRPDLPGVMHYKGQRVFVAGLSHGTEWFDDFSVGKYDAEGSNGTFKDAEDGVLAKNFVENGQVDSVLGLKLELQAYDSVRLSYWLVAAETVATAEAVFDEIVANGVTHYIARTAAYWHEWISTATTHFSAGTLPEYMKALETSLFVMKAHMDENGAVVASLDSSLRNHPQDDAYNFCWPRDAVYTLWPLLRLGYTDELLQFFTFARNGLHTDGYLYHKYRADGSLGSTWLPYEQPDGTVHPPIQADETAGVLFLLGQYYRYTADTAFVAEQYDSLIAPMANFLAGYRSEDGLPLPSYDLWEHSYLTHTYTTAVTYAALVEAGELAVAHGQNEDADRWRAAANGMKAASTCLFNASAGYFYKGFLTNTNGEKQFDATIDLSSLYGVSMFGLFAVQNDEVTAALETARHHLANGDLYGRFVGDDYYAGSSAPNLWPLASLWMAEIALERGDIDTAKRGLGVVLSLQSPSGMLPEQVAPETHAATSLSPLVWSHAELVSMLIDYAQQTEQDEPHEA